MNDMKRILELPSGKELVEKLISEMLTLFPDFEEDRQRFQSAMQQLEASLGADTAPSVQEEMQAIEQQTASTLLYSFYLGLQANWNHFMDPVGRSFLSVDPDTYLRRITAHNLPEYVNAQQVRSDFYRNLNEEQQSIYTEVSNYISNLETAGAHLAHFYGFVYGNTLLYRICPGYHCDRSLTVRYRSSLEHYFGINLSA